MTLCNDRQFLLHHLLDPVATQGLSICLVGLMQQFALKKQREKRIKGCMEGTSKDISVGACPSIIVIQVTLSQVKSSINDWWKCWLCPQSACVVIFCCLLLKFPSLSGDVCFFLPFRSMAQHKRTCSCGNNNHINTVQQLLSVCPT